MIVVDRWTILAVACAVGMAVAPAWAPAQDGDPGSDTGRPDGHAPELVRSVRDDDDFRGDRLIRRQTLSDRKWMQHTVRFSPDGAFLAVGGADAEVHLWRVGNRRIHCVSEWKTDADQQFERADVWTISFVDGLDLVYCNHFGLHDRLWHLNRTGTRPRLIARPETLSRGRFAGNRLVTTRGVYTLDRETGTLTRVSETGAIAVSDDGRRLLGTGRPDDPVEWWQMADDGSPTRGGLLQAGLTTDDISACTLGPRGRLVAGIVERTLHVWRLPPPGETGDATSVGEWRIPDDEYREQNRPEELAFSRDGRWLMLAHGAPLDAEQQTGDPVRWTSRSALRLFRCSDRGRLQPVLVEPDATRCAISDIDFSPDGRHVATTGSDRREMATTDATVWQLPFGRVRIGGEEIDWTVPDPDEEAGRGGDGTRWSVAIDDDGRGATLTIRVDAVDGPLALLRAEVTAERHDPQTIWLGTVRPGSPVERTIRVSADFARHSRIATIRTMTGQVVNRLSASAADDD